MILPFSILAIDVMNCDLNQISINPYYYLLSSPRPALTARRDAGIPFVEQVLPRELTLD